MEGYRTIHPDEPWQWYSDDAVYEDNGLVELRAFSEPNTIIFEGKEYHPTVATGVLYSIQTFLYGTFSAEIQLPVGKNLWPGFWLCGSGVKWPGCGEIDIMEAWANRAGSYYRFPFGYRVTTNVHFAYKGTPADVGSRNTSIFRLPNPTNNFVRYEVEWRPDVIIFRANGKELRHVGFEAGAKYLAGKPQHVIFDCWTASADFSFTQPMEINDFKYQPLE